MDQLQIGEGILQKHGHRVRKLLESLAVIFKIEIYFGMPLAEENFESDSVGPDVLCVTRKASGG